jgi:hypothetical protein
MLYTKSAALRILSQLAIKIESVQLIRNTVQVTYRTQHGRCSTFLSKRVFKRDFVEFRKANAQSITITRTAEHSTIYTAWNVGQKTVYQVTLSPQSIQCECEDYRQQVEAFKIGCCKHGYALLNTIGYSNLNEYLNSQVIAA